MVHISNEGFVAQLQALVAAAHKPGGGGTVFLTQKRGALFCPAPPPPAPLPPSLPPRPSPSPTLPLLLQWCRAPLVR